MEYTAASNGTATIHKQQPASLSPATPFGVAAIMPFETAINNAELPKANGKPIDVFRSLLVDFTFAFAFG